MLSLSFNKSTKNWVIQEGFLLNSMIALSVCHLCRRMAYSFLFMLSDYIIMFALSLFLNISLFYLHSHVFVFMFAYAVHVSLLRPEIRGHKMFKLLNFDFQVKLD